MIRKNKIAKGALIAMFVLGTVSCMMAQRGGDTQQTSTTKRGSGDAAATRPAPVANGSDSAIHLVIADKGQEPDPNMPDSANQYNPMLSYTVDDTGPGSITFMKPNHAVGRYLGFNDKGSWIQNQGDGKVYIWSGQDRTLTVGAQSQDAIPLDVLASLRNSHVRPYLAKRMNNGVPTTAVASNDKPAGNDVINDPGKAPDVAPANPTNAMGASTKLKGDGATIRAGVLTFTVNDPASPKNGKSVSYKVVRPAIAIVNPNAPRPNDITGQWVGEDPNDKDAVLLFFVQGKTGAVAMQAMSGPAAAVMKRMLVAAPQ